MSEERNFVVVYEETLDDQQPEDDILIDVDVYHKDERRAVEADFGAVVSNEASVWALIGLIMAIVGAVVAIVTGILWLIYYPDKWWPEPTDGVPRVVIGMTLLSSGLLIVGNLFIGFGRSLRARGVLHSLRFSRLQDE